MPRRRRCKVFVSYSRHDEELVKPLAGLLGAAANDAVFLDVNSIKPGKLWKGEIETALREASVYVLCWCCESHKSQFVWYELNIARDSAEKRLVPVLLCDTPLPPPMADRQWIDLRGRVVHACGDHRFDREERMLGGRLTGDGPAGPRFDGGETAPSPKRPAWPWVGIGAAAAVLIVGIYFATFTRHAPAPTSAPAPVEPMVEPAVGPVVAALIGLVITFLLIVFLLKKGISALRKRFQRRHAERLAATAEGYFQSLGR